MCKLQYFDASLLLLAKNARRTRKYAALVFVFSFVFCSFGYFSCVRFEDHSERLQTEPPFIRKKLNDTPFDPLNVFLQRAESNLDLRCVVVMWCGALG